jgi:cytochrome c biogenesis protein CcmG/thiol:disulfide interchange protein DsbE
MAIDQNSEAAPRKPGFNVPWWVQVPIYVVVVGLLVLVALQMRRNGPLAAGPVGAGQRAPEFALTSFDGENVTLAGLKGKVVVVNFWASWCIPCEDEAADLEATWRAYRDQDVVFLGVDYVDTETEARAYLNRFGITYLNGPDLGTKISQAYRIQGVPETYIVDKTGTLARVIIGPTTAADLRVIIEPLLD